MKESALWNTMKGGLAGIAGLHVQRVENSALPGTPDVELCYRGHCAWIELKLIEKFPAREATLVRIDHYTDEQKLWLRLRGQAGGKAWLFVQVRKSGYFLFDWEVAQFIGTIPQGDWYRLASAVWKKRCPWTVFLKKVLI